ncbi:MAG TPA: hypothetical protein VHH34_01825, partial [Pseudonocardiaceae bacterium]|nr:hypothetical protein [Pseudonocardiaceae bacterium]
MGLGDILDGAKDFGAGVVDGAQEAASGLVDGAQNVASTVVGGVQQFASDPVGTVTSVFGGGDPSGNDGGSSNWAAWGHEEIRAMLDDSVHPGTIGEGAQVWNQRSREASDIISTFTRDLRATVSGGWRGTAADAAMASLDPVDQWSTSLNQASDYTTRLVDHSGSAVGQAKDMVPDPVSHNWGRTVGGFALGGPFGAGIDAVAQDRAQEQARLEAVRIMTGVYSTPINENRAAVPTYPQLADPTLQPPEQPPITGPSPGGGG